MVDADTAADPDGSAAATKPYAGRQFLCAVGDRYGANGDPNSYTDGHDFPGRDAHDMADVDTAGGADGSAAPAKPYAGR